MQTSVRAGMIGAMALAVVLAGCSGDASTGPSSDLVADSVITDGVVNDAGDAVATSVDLMNADEQAEGADASLGVGSSGVWGNVGTNCTGPDGEGWFSCTRTTWKGLSLVKQVRYWDGTSFGLAFTQATDSVNHIHTLTGSYNQGWFPFRTVWVDRRDTATMHVDRSTTPHTHTWDGVGARQDSTEYVAENVTRHWHYTAFDTATAVVFDVPRADNPWPMSGTIVQSLAVQFEADRASRTRTRTVTRRVQITFNGTPNVTLVVGGLTCTLDLETHQVSDCHGS